MSLAWIDRRLDPDDIDYDPFYTNTFDGAAFLPDVRVSTTPSVLGLEEFIGDYNGPAAPARAAPAAPTAATASVRRCSCKGAPMLSTPRLRRSGGAPWCLLAGIALAACLGGAPESFGGGALDPRTAAAGLKDALSAGTGRSVDALGRVDGYLKNPDVRIPMPDKLRTVDRGLRAIGKGDLVDVFVTSMNRAAEAAAPLARTVFLDTIKEMSFTDALGIVRGRDHEATDYLRANAGPRLRTLFTPIVRDQLRGVGATRSFDAMMRRASGLPLVGKSAFSLEDYVTGKALDGMFLMIGREEERIRKDPVARTNDLLRRVFGAAGGVFPSGGA